MMRLDIRVTADDIAADIDPEKVRDGLKDIVGLAGDAPFRGLSDDHPALVAFDELVNTVVADCVPQVSEILLAEFRKHLPFEWAEGAWEGAEP